MLNNINTMKRQRGFTIVELLIVIVVIAILAAISIVAYTGIQNRAKSSSGQSLASQVSKKAQAYYTVAASYPTYAQLTAATSTVPEAQLDDVNAVTDYLVSTYNVAGTYENGNEVVYRLNGPGACVYWWDFAGGPPAQQAVRVGTPTAC